MQASLTDLSRLRMLACMTKLTKASDETAVLFVRQFPKGLLGRLKAAAALNGKTLGDYIQTMCEVHVEDLERRGQLPKNK